MAFKKDMVKAQKLAEELAERAIFDERSYVLFPISHYGEHSGVVVMGDIRRYLTEQEDYNRHVFSSSDVGLVRAIIWVLGHCAREHKDRSAEVTKMAEELGEALDKSCGFGGDCDYCVSDGDHWADALWAWEEAGEKEEENGG